MHLNAYGIENELDRRDIVTLPFVDPQHNADGSYDSNHVDMTDSHVHEFLSNHSQGRKRQKDCPAIKTAAAASSLAAKACPRRRRNIHSIELNRVLSFHLYGLHAFGN